MFVHVIYSEESPGESCGFAEGYQERGVDFSLRVDEDTAEEKNQSTGRKDKGSYKLQVDFHMGVFFEIECKYAHIFEDFANFPPQFSK